MNKSHKYAFFFTMLALPASELSATTWTLNEQEFVWNEPDTWSAKNISEKLLHKAYNKIGKRVNGSNYTELVNLNDIFEKNAKNFVTTACGHPNFAEAINKIPSGISGAHAPQGNTYNITTTTYELWQEQQSRRGIKRVNNWYTHWNISNLSTQDIFISNKENHMHTYGPVSFSRNSFNKPGYINSYTTVDSKMISIGVSGGFQEGASVNFSTPKVSFKSEGVHPYACSGFLVNVEENTAPEIIRVVSDSGGVYVDAKDKHTTSDFLSYQWDVTTYDTYEEIELKNKFSGRSIKIGAYDVASYVLTVSDGQKSVIYKGVAKGYLAQ